MSQPQRPRSHPQWPCLQDDPQLQVLKRTLEQHAFSAVGWARTLEASFESAGGAVQLHVFFEGGKHAFDRYRVRGTARFSGLDSSRS